MHGSYPTASVKLSRAVSLALEIMFFFYSFFSIPAHAQLSPALFGFEVSLSTTSNQVLIKLSDLLQMSLKMRFFLLSLSLLPARTTVFTTTLRQTVYDHYHFVTA